MAKAEKNEAILHGPLLRSLTVFALPIILSNLFQQLYSTVDAVIVGRMVSDEALTAISVAGPLMDVVNALLIGGCVGISVRIAHLSGAGDPMQLKKSLSTALTGGLALTAVLAVLGLVSVRRVLLWQETPPEVLEEATAYLSITLVGLLCCYLYNYYAAVLRAYGDSQTPFYVLLFSSLLHVVLDLFLVGTLHWGVRGVAISTVLCQLLSALCCAGYIARNYTALTLRRNEFLFIRQEGRLLLRFASTAAMQQAVVCLGRFLIQGMLNGLGAETVTGYNMGMRVEALLLCFSSGISAAASVFISQNQGCGQYSRLRRCFLYATGLSVGVTLCLSIVCYLCPVTLVGMFSDNEAIVTTGAYYLRTMSFIYLAPAVAELCQGYLRGVGKTGLTAFNSMAQVTLRVILSYYLVARLGVLGICIAVATGWILLAVFLFPYINRHAKRYSLQ